MVVIFLKVLKVVWHRQYGSHLQKITKDKNFKFTKILLEFGRDILCKQDDENASWNLIRGLDAVCHTKPAYKT